MAPSQCSHGEFLEVLASHIVLCREISLVQRLPSAHFTLFQRDPQPFIKGIPGGLAVPWSGADKKAQPPVLCPFDKAGSPAAVHTLFSSPLRWARHPDKSKVSWPFSRNALLECSSLPFPQKQERSPCSHSVLTSPRRSFHLSPQPGRQQEAAAGTVGALSGGE